MKKAVITTGSHQYIVKKGDILDVELVGDKKTLSFEPLMVIDGEKTTVGAPTVASAKVSAKVVEEDFKGDKVKIVKFKAKKNYRRNKGHRQHYSRIEITAV